MSTLWQRQSGTKLVSLLRHHVQKERVIEESVFCWDTVGVEAKANDLRGRDRDETDLSKRKEKRLDKTIADSFPASDPPSSIPDPEKHSFPLWGFCSDFRVVFL
jgi:hypothetical protein